MYYSIYPKKNKLSQSSFTDIKFTEFALNNGLEVIITKDDTIPSAALHITYHVGSKDEAIGEKGYAHLIEHLMFEGSSNLAPGDYDMLISERGCENNAYTTEDKSVYYVLLPSNQLEFALWIESCRMLSLQITEETLETQKKVIIEEKKQVLDNRPYGSLSSKIAEKLFIKGGYATDIIGLEEDISNASFNSIIHFHDNFYKPSNALLTVSGDLDIDTTAQMIEKYFGKIPNRGLTLKPDFISASLSDEVNENIYDKTHLQGLFISYRVPGENTNELYALEILSKMLSYGESSFLYKNLVHDKMLALDIGSWYEPRECEGVFTIYAVLMPGIKHEQVKNEIDSIIYDISTGNVDRSSFQKAKNLIETRNIFRLQTNFNKTELLSHYKIFYGNAGEINYLTDKYNSVDESFIINTATEYLTTKKRLILNYFPKNS